MGDNDNEWCHCQEKTLRRNRHLPPRPKKPLSAYTAFLKDYFKTHRPRNTKEAREVMRTASEVWKTKTDWEKRRFARTGAKERKMYERAMTKWRLQEKLCKRPASSYALFLKETWEAERDSGRNVGDMSEHASSLWRGMTKAAKDVYVEQHKVLAEKYYAAMKLLDSGDVDIDAVSVRTNGALPKPGETVVEEEMEEDFDEEDEEEPEQPPAEESSSEEE